MNLDELLSPFVSTPIKPIALNGMQNDSRFIQPGDLFCAYPGAASDGRDYLQQTADKGCAAIVYEQTGSEHLVLPKTLPCIPCPQLAEKLALLASRFYHNPSSKLNVYGVTGTNGKTTIAYQLAQARSFLNEQSAYIGTLGQGLVGQLQPLANTTPDGLLLQKTLSHYVEQGLDSVCMEVSSHALSLHRVDGMLFKQAIFTNLTHDHLDFHQTMDDYAKAKAALFAWPQLEVAIINADDTYAPIMKAAIQSGVQCLTYGFAKSCDIRIAASRMDIHGTHLSIESPWGSQDIAISSLGRFNIYNTLAVYTSLLASGVPIQALPSIMSQLKAAPGRLEIVARHPLVVVDYAHTPDALANVLTTLNQVKKGRLWVIFGCGGDRDKTKRPKMGEIASLHADQIIVTSDNPRTEDPEQIIADIMAGIHSDKPILQETDRTEAIHQALSQAHQEDIILIAGKGHEAYQQIGLIKHPYSDQEVVKSLMKM